MRLLVEIIVAAALLAMAWQKSFKEWASEVPGVGPDLTAPAVRARQLDPKARRTIFWSPTIDTYSV